MLLREKAKGFQLATYTSRYEKKQGKCLSSWLALHWLFRAVPRQHQKQNQPTQNKGKKIHRQIQKATLTLTGRLLTGAVETTLTANQESGQTQPSQRLVTALRYCTDILITLIKAVLPPSPTALNVATFRQQLKTVPRQPLKQHHLQPAAIKIDITIYPRQIAAPLL